MNKIDQVDKLKEQFYSEYGSKLAEGGNQLAIGIGKDPKTGEYTIEARLTNKKLKNILPVNYHGVKVNTLVIGVIRPL